MVANVAFLAALTTFLAVAWLATIATRSSGRNWSMRTLSAFFASGSRSAGFIEPEVSTRKTRLRGGRLAAAGL